MPAFGLLGLALFALQVVLGVHAYRSLAVGGRGSAIVAGVAVALLGLFVLVELGLLALLAYDLAAGVVLQHVRQAGPRAQSAT